jgi:hypothetical protein
MATDNKIYRPTGLITPGLIAEDTLWIVPDTVIGPIGAPSKPDLIKLADQYLAAGDKENWCKVVDQILDHLKIVLFTPCEYAGSCEIDLEKCWAEAREEWERNNDK